MNEWTNIRTYEGTKERTSGQRSTAANGSRLLIGTSQLPTASQLAYAHLVCSFSSPRSSALFSRYLFLPLLPLLALLPPRFHLDTLPKYIRSAGAATRGPRALLMDSILCQIGNRLVAVVVIRCAARDRCAPMIDPGKRFIVSLIFAGARENL